MEFHKTSQSMSSGCVMIGPHNPCVLHGNQSEALNLFSCKSGMILFVADNVYLQFFVQKKSLLLKT